MGSPKNPLTPRKVVNIKGKFHYSESNQAWNVLKLKSEFLNEFPQLKEKRSQFSYEFKFLRDEKELEALLKDAKGTPVLMFIYRE